MKTFFQCQSSFPHPASIWILFCTKKANLNVKNCILDTGLPTWQNFRFDISMHFLHIVLYTYSVDKENLSDKQEFLDFMIISFILMSFMFELAVILLGGIRCVSLSGVKGLKDTLVTWFPFLAEFPVSFHSIVWVWLQVIFCNLTLCQLWNYFCFDSLHVYLSQIWTAPYSRDTSSHSSNGIHCRTRCPGVRWVIIIANVLMWNVI